MGNEGIQSNKSSIVGELGTSMAITGAIAGVGGVKSVIRNKGLPGAIDALEIAKFKDMKLALRSAGEDVFSTGIQLSQNYDALNSLTKNAHKLNKIVAKQKLPLFTRIRNVFSKNPTTLAEFQTKAKAASDALSDAKLKLASGTDLVESGAKLVGSSGLDTAKNLFKSELKNKFVLGITILGALPRIKEEIIPAFKEKGVWEGIKTTAKVVARTGADFISNAGFSAVGRFFGSALGTVFCPGAGSAIGGMLGDAVGSFFSMKLISKIFDKKKNNNQEAQAMASNAQQSLTPEQQEAYIRRMQARSASTNSESSSKGGRTYESTTKPRTQSGYQRPTNGVYKTPWVNDLHKQREAQAKAQANYYA